MYLKDINYKLYCQQDGHLSQEITQVCIYQDCNQKRVCCQSCLQNHNHSSINLTSRYIIKYEIFKNLFIERQRNLFFQFTSIIEEEFIQMLNEEIIKIKISNKQNFYEKIVYYSYYELMGWKLTLSNNKRLIVKQGMFKIVLMEVQNGLRVYRSKKFNAIVQKILFSPSDTYLYISTETQLIQLQISNHIQNFIDYHFDKDFELLCISETQLLIASYKRIKVFDFKAKQQILEIDTYYQIKCWDFQAKSNNFVVFTGSMIQICNTNGNYVCDKSSYDYKFEEESKVKFFGNHDILLSVELMKLIIWQVDYKHQDLILEKIILCSHQIRSFDLCEKKNKIYILTNGHIAVYKLGQNSLQSCELVQNDDFQLGNLDQKEVQIFQILNKTYFIRNFSFFMNTFIRGFRNNL